PSGAPCAAPHAGKRSSSGMINALPRGERPSTASTIRLAKASARPGREKRVGSINSPRTPIDMMRLDGMAKKPRILERGKNIGAPAGGSHRVCGKGKHAGALKGERRAPGLPAGHVFFQAA